VTNQHRVVSRCVELAVDGVVQRGVDEDFAAFEGENFVEDEVSLEGGLGIGIGSSSVTFARLRAWVQPKVVDFT
jgi:hypothetical protein